MALNRITSFPQHRSLSLPPYSFLGRYIAHRPSNLLIEFRITARQMLPVMPHLLLVLFIVNIQIDLSLVSIAAAAAADATTAAFC